MAFETKLNELHHEYIKKCMASFVSSPTEITRRLADTEIAEQSGYIPVKITVQRISALLIQWKKDEDLMEEIAKLRAKYLLDFTEMPLMHKKERVAVLIARFHAIKGNGTKENPGMKDKKGATLSDRVMLDYEMRIIRQISDEAGESLEKIAKILASGGGITVNVTLKDRILGHYEAPSGPR